MNRYVYPQEIKMPAHTRKTRTVTGETEIRVGKKPPTTATETRIKTNPNRATSSQLIPTPNAANDTMVLLGLIDGKRLIREEDSPADFNPSFCAARSATNPQLPELYSRSYVIYSEFVRPTPV
jgi:hypothetical protein